MGKKISAYARKRRALGKPLGHTQAIREKAAISTMVTLACHADRMAPPPAGHDFVEGIATSAADKAEKTIREALQSLLDHKLPKDPEDTLQTLNAALILGTERSMAMIYGKNQPEDDGMMDIEKMPPAAQEAMLALQAGREAWIRTIDRWRERKQWGLDAEARIDLQDAMDVSIALMRASTIQQMEEAYASSQKRIDRMEQKGLI